ncbi:hypothetical protein LIA77_10919 [Sarocladium implicatum]|nr:hypothetical protein LIA77_10919 [Sarocladium implicatum]
MQLLKHFSEPFIFSILLFFFNSQSYLCNEATEIIMSLSSPIDLEIPRKRRSTGSDQEEQEAKRIARFFNNDNERGLPVKAEPMDEQEPSFSLSPPWSSHHVDPASPSVRENSAGMGDEAVRHAREEYEHGSVSSYEAQGETHITPDQSDEEDASNNGEDWLGTEWIDEMSSTAFEHDGVADAEVTFQRPGAGLIGVRRHGKSDDAAHDLVLLIGPQQEAIMVHRAIISVCCPKLLKSDAQPADSGIYGVPQLFLPHEDPDAIFNLLELLCPSSEDVAKLSVRETALAAEAAHKYECIRRIQDRIHGTFNEAMQQHGEMKAVLMQDLWDLIIAAYWLGSAAWFEHFTSLMITGKPNSYLNMAMQTKQTELGLRISLALEEVGRATSSNPSSAASGRSGLCLDCFKAAKDSFEHRADCKMCYDLERGTVSRGALATSRPLALVLTQH